MVAFRRSGASPLGRWTRCIIRSRGVHGRRRTARLMGTATVLETFHPLVRRWFERRFGEPTEPQALGWPEIAARRDALLSAPTGSGKTLAAFLYGLDGL